jgi:hypothetical protein
VAGSIVAVLAIAAIAFIVFSGGGANEVAGGDDDAPAVETPHFSFKLDDRAAVSTVEVETKNLKGAAKEVAGQTADLLESMVTAGYLDPANWQEGAYDTVLQAFDGPARETAEDSIDSLTAGPDAGERFERIDPARSRLSVTVLFDDENDAATIEADATFSVAAVAADGSTTRILSRGRYFLQPAGSDWKITAFDVDRREKAGDPPADASSTPAEAAS